MDWIIIKTEYITSEIGYRKLAEKHGVSMSTLSKRAQKEDWKGEKIKNREKVVKKAVRKAANKESTILAKELILADQITNVLDKALSDAKQFNRFLVQIKERRDFDADEWVEEKIFKKIDMKALKDAAETLRIVEGMKRSMHHLLTEPEKQKFKLERERLSLEKKKSGIDDGSEDGGTGVIVVAELLPENEERIELPEEETADEE